MASETGEVLSTANPPLPWVPPILAWICGLAWVQDCVDVASFSVHAGKASRHTSLVMQWLNSSWWNFWPTVLAGSLVALPVAWFVAAGWFNLRVGFCGVARDAATARRVYFGSQAIWTIPAVLLLVVQSFVYRNNAGVEAVDSSGYAVVSVLLFGSCYAAYRGVRRGFPAARVGPSRFWFLVAPVAAYSAYFGVIAAGVLLADKGLGIQARDGKPDIIRVKDDDPSIKVAVERARKEVGTFITALKEASRHPERRNYAVKVAVAEGKIVEHLWLTEPTFDGKIFQGKVGNDPDELKALKLGDKHTVTPAQASDWMYVENNKLVGGYTIRALRATYTPEQRKQLDESMDFTIE